MIADLWTRIGLLLSLIAGANGEYVKVTQDGAELRVGQRVEAKLQAGEVLLVTARKGGWLGAALTKPGGGKLSGWIRASDTRVLLVKQPARLVQEPKGYSLMLHYQGASSKFKQTSLYSIWSKSGMKEFLMGTKIDRENILGCAGFGLTHVLTPDFVSAVLQAESYIVVNGVDKKSKVPKALFALNTHSVPGLRKVMSNYFARMALFFREEPKEINGFQTFTVTEDDQTGGFAFGTKWFLASVSDEMLLVAVRDLSAALPNNPLTGKAFAATDEAIFSTWATNQIVIDGELIGVDPETVAEAKEAAGKLDWLGLTVSPHGRGFRTSLLVKQSGNEDSSSMLSDSSLKWVPKNSPMFLAVSLKADRVLDTALKTTEIAGKKTGVALKEVERVIGKEMRDGVLRNIGNESVFVLLPGNVAGLPNVVMNVAVTFEGDFDKDLDELLDDANKKLREHPGPFFGRTPFQIHRSSMNFRGSKIGIIHFTGFPVPFAPSYAIQGKRFMMAAYPQVLKDYLVFLNEKQPSILESADFQRVRTSLPKDLEYLCYTELKTGARDLYGAFPMIFSAINGLPGDEGTFEIGRLPEWGAIEQHLSGAVIGGYTVNGIQTVEVYSPLIVPLPGGESTLNGLGMSTALMGILIPAITRYASKDLLTRNALRQLGLGALEYMQESGDETLYPKSLEDIYTSKIITEKELFISPDDHEPAKFKGGLMSSYQSAFDISKIRIPADAPSSDLLMIWERKVTDGTRQVVTFGVDAKTLSEEEFQKERKKLESYLKKL